MKEFLRDRERQGKVSEWTGIGVTAGVHGLVSVVLLLTGMTFLDPPPPAKEYFEMDLPEIVEEEQQHPVPWGEETTAEKANDSEETELVKQSDSPIQADSKPNKADAGRQTETGDTDVPQPNTEIQNPDINFGALHRPDGNKTSDTAENTSDNVSSGQADGNVSDGVADGTAQARVEGRSTERLGTPKIETQKEGRVVVDITVDRDGNVLTAVISPKSNMILSDREKNIILNTAKNETRFNKDSRAEEIQKGTITYIFVLTQ